ncbi:MAG: CDP-diacylglycerol--glycerol-3-phosphate 3-phosphatidyltransferase [candidate division Zixibacteria bacterium]|nr:CDP-diacylglycerol--glycerol-3-phosphate 3-phosphatidyltransferase [candidate division Zixibacteria bacterium]
MNLPNKLTITRIVLSPVFMILFLIDNSYTKVAALLIFFAAALTDWFDGHLARKHGWMTSFGKFMDPLADKVLTSTALICFVALDYVRVWMVLTIVGREFLVTGLRSLAAYKGWIIMPTYLARWKTGCQMVVILGILLYYDIRMLLEPMGINLQALDSPWAGWVIDLSVFFVMVLTVITGLDYLIKNIALLKGVLR